MSSPPKAFDLDEVKKHFKYDPETGEIFWIAVTRNKSNVLGSIAGTIDRSGYVLVTLNRRRYLAHRLAWALYYDEVPVLFIDHINENKADNRIENLRLVTKSENLQNQKKPSARSSTGYRGVSTFRNGKYRATINIGGKNVHLGSFDTAEEASEAYIAAKNKHHISNSIELDRLAA